MLGGFLPIIKRRGGENRTDARESPVCKNEVSGGPKAFSQGRQLSVPTVTSYNAE